MRLRLTSILDETLIRVCIFFPLIGSTNRPCASDISEMVSPPITDNGGETDWPKL
jgi:hypothetical protein